jgi:glycosyltransferase involved in cell wall biosynthesis
VGWTTDDAAIERVRNAGGEIHRVDMRRRPTSRQNAAAIVRLRRLIRQVRPDVVHGHSSVGGAVARLAATRTRAVRVYTSHGLRPSRPLLAVERVLGRMTDVLIAVSPGERAAALEAHLAAASRIEIIPNGIDLALPPPHPMDLRSSLGLPDDALLVATIGRLVPQKAPEQFVRAAAVVVRSRPDVHFVMIGAGPLAPLVAEEVRASDLGDRFHALGTVPDAAQLLPQVDVFVLASRFEGCPYTPLEAMRAGVPVILTDVVGNRDVVDAGVSGLLVPPEDPTALGRAIVDVLGDAALRSSLAAEGRRRIVEHHDVSVMGAALAKLYERLATARS